VSALATTVAPPALSEADDRRQRPLRLGERVAVDHRAVLELATADDLAAGMTEVSAIVRRVTGAARVEWWAPTDDGALGLVAADGHGLGIRHELPLGRAGVFVLAGGHREPRLTAALAPLEPIVRRRASEERLARVAVELARRNEALEDFAALVAHELKGPLHAALASGDASGCVGQALHVVETLLEVTRADGEAADEPIAALDRAIEDLGAGDLEVTAELDDAPPVPAAALRVIFRNLLANAAAAGARHVHVTAVGSAVHVDDDGVGLDARDGYASGSGLGLELCRRLAARLGAAIELTPRASGGTRATLVLGPVAP
jgi:signal transduction histidine kinase